MEFFGIDLDAKKTKEKLETFSLDREVTSDAAVELQHYGAADGVSLYSFNTSTVPVEEAELIQTYRRIASSSEIDEALQEIRNEVFIFDIPDKRAFDLAFYTESKLSDSIKKKIQDEFDTLYNVIDFQNKGIQYFDDWYIDSKLIMNKIIDKNQPKKGIKKVSVIDPLKIRKIRQLPQPDRNGVYDINQIREFYVYSERAYNNYDNKKPLPYDAVIQGLKIRPESICFVNSNLYDRELGLYVGYLKKAIIPFNNLKMMEDSMVIYRVVRAPQRRVFYIDIGAMQPNKAEEYIKKLQAKFKNRLAYDSRTGTMVDRRNVMSMIEDFWLGRRCLSLNTKIRLMGNNEKTLRELIKDYNEGKENWTFSVSPNGTVVPGKISWAGVTQRNAQTMKIVLDNNEEIICTPEHKFILRDGRKVKAKDLRDNDSLMPAYFDIYKNKWITTFGYKIKSIEYLSEGEDVGTLTIDEKHELHDYHNFALSAGIFVMNSDGRTTEIQTLDGQQSQDILEEVEYFRQKLWRSLNVPLSRFSEQPMGFMFGKGVEIQRDEYRFKKYLNRIRENFLMFMEDLLRTQLILKKIILESEWSEIKDNIYWEYAEDNAFVEYKESEIFNNRVEQLQRAENYIGKFFSKKWVMKNILRMTDEEIKQQEKEIAAEPKPEKDEEF